MDCTVAPMSQDRPSLVTVSSTVSFIFAPSIGTEIASCHTLFEYWILNVQLLPAPSLGALVVGCSLPVIAIRLSNKVESAAIPLLLI